ncbi:hypothetical protein GGI05_004479 [Coemansia sp. RSA 2603]|nr:hypothetical protein GGI05_004479 [Coemansia sp. RSA 2603]
MPAQPAVYPLYNGNLEGIGSGSASGPLLGAFESGATMLWADPGQHTLGSSGNRPIRGHSDNSHTPSHVEVNGGSGQQRGYKSANRTPRPIGTRNTPTGGSRNVRSRQGNGNSQSSAHDHIQKQQQQQQQHQHWFPQYAGIQPQIYMHSPAPGYAASSPHNSPHMAAVHAAGGSAGISSYMVPFSHMAETGNPHHHPMLAMQQAPLAPLSSSSQNHPHVHSQLHGGNSAENVKSPAYMGTLQPQYFSNHAHASPPQQYAYAYAGPPTGSQHHHSQHHQHHHNQQAYSPYTTVPSYGVDPVHGGYAPMYMGHVDVSQGVPGGQYYHTSTDPQLSEQQQQQQHYQQSPLSLSAVPFQPSMSVKQENLDQQPPGQHSQRPRSKGLELIQRSASNSDVNTVTSTPKKDFQSDNAAVPTISAAGTVSSKALQADPKPKSRSGTPESNLAKESQGRGRRSQDRRSQDRRSQDRRNPKQQPANVTASANATLSSAKQVAADTETAQSPPKSDSKRRPKSDRAKKASKPASTELAQEPAEQQQQTGKRGRGGHARSGRGAKRTDKAVLKA